MKYRMVFCAVAVCIVSLVAQTALPTGYGGVTLGMTFDAARAAISTNSEFGFTGERDVSLLTGENRTLIETDPKTRVAFSFLDRCWFQFEDDRLTAITILLNAERIDHYSVFTALMEKYGAPDSLSPQKAVWQNQTVVMSLERPLTLKYVIATPVEAVTVLPPGATEASRRAFLNGL
ncbi:MAG: hypothetical protein IJ191_01785 [Treponema sp.]|nr:hypothetical protein [Treponema sp.]